MMKNAAIASMLVLLLQQAAAAADNDVQFWTEAGVRYKINKQFRLKFDQHLRFDEDVSHVKSIMPELALLYRPLKYLRLQIGYRYIAEPFDDNGETFADSWHRFYIDIRFRLRFKPVTLRYRFRFQEEFGEPWTGYSQAASLETKPTLRNKLELAVKAGKHLKPFVSAELFNRLGDPDRALQKLRLTPGLAITLNSHEISLFYRAEICLFEENRGAVTHEIGDTNHILALGYHYRF